MISRRSVISSMILLPAASVMPANLLVKPAVRKTTFRFCLNTSTISGQDPGLARDIEIASKAGYDGIEIWVRDVRQYLDSGHSLRELKQKLDEAGIIVENAIGFAPWLAPGEGFIQMEEEMEMLAAIGCKRIAAPPAGLDGNQPLDLFRAGEKYALLLEMGRRTGVMPQLEFWGASPVLWHLGQVLMVAAVAGDPDARILPDVYHLFRGGSGFEPLRMISGDLVDVFHMNDYPGDKPREEQVDSDRVFPGDGDAPFGDIMDSLKAMGGVKILSLELFNREYWQEDPLEVARKGLEKMKLLIR
ncbi:MAG: sugar phosphate isomerase/epimerase [Bacteroidetes bacterium]|nr:MAG: sugar phosphate isomerase/epimerase [Bacteroidota bacterium]